MTPQSTTERSGRAEGIIYVDWPLARWSQNVSYRRGLKMLPHRHEPRVVVGQSGRFPGGGVAA